MSGIDEYGHGNEDYEYDEARQRLVDAEAEGELAGQQGKTSQSCLYYPFEAEYAAWHRGWLRETVKREKLRRVA